MSDRIKKLIDILKSWKGEKPDLENLDFSRYHQTEEEYQAEQKEWLASVEKKAAAESGSKKKKTGG
ncbi:MAG: hypothetical protein ACOZBW_01575 [Thermodesulfobacteriota bacterium]